MKSKKNTSKKSRAYDKQYKVMAILLFSFAILLLLSLISYTHKDDENARVSLFELFGLLSGDPIIEAKAATTLNWLGLFGAWISNLLYNKTVGFAFLPFPLFIIAWLRYLFNGTKVSDGLIKNTTIYLVMTVLFSALMGSLMTFENMSDISREWSGSIGQFLASVFSGLLSPVGSVILFISGMLITLYLGTDIKFGTLFEVIGKWFASAKAGISEYVSDKNDEDEQTETVDNEEDEVEKTDDKAKIVNSNIKPETVKISEDSISREEPARDIQRKPTVIINRSFPKDSHHPVANPFDSSTAKNEPVPDHNLKNIVNEIKPEIPKEPEIPVFRPNFKNVKEESFTSLDIVDEVKNTESKADDIVAIPEQSIDEPVDSSDSERGTTEIGKTINLSGILNKPIDKTVETALTSGSYNDVPEERYPQDDISEYIPDIPKVKQKFERPPIDLIGTAIHEEKIIYKFPGMEILNNERAKSFVDEEELQMNARILTEKLETFKIYIENLSVTPGPVVTQYEFVPAAGIKISKIESLSDDLAMALKAKGIRIIAPIPGKGTIGIEIPNANPAIVRFGETVDSPKFRNSDAKLPVVMGKTISGDIYVIDLAKMPHLLIAGSTGSGKSVGINTIIASLVYKMHPSELKFVMIDPKKVELQSYSKLRNHYMAASPEVNDSIVTKPEDAVTILKAAVAEMELRYDILASVRQRNIADYNFKVKQGAFKDITEMAHRPMPYIVVIIDELADLMLIASKEIEEPITRLAQMARAIGIHLVVATQRPSVDVITGVIKANFPARMAYLVTSKIDSRTILDMQGAEQLLGQGDMLCLPPGSPKPVRIQNSFISTDEVENICDFIGDQKGYSEPYYLPSITEKSDNNVFYDASDRDPLFEDAARLMVQHQQGSVSLLQRRLKIGYARAGRIVDELERAGILGPFDGSKARLVLIDSESALERIL